MSLVLSGNGYPCIAYDGGIETGDLRYATFNGTSWNIQILDSVGYIGGWASLALDSQGKPHICYMKSDDATSKGTLKYTTYNGSSWTYETVSGGDCGYYSAIALDSKDIPYICFYNNPDYSVKCANKTTSGWHISDVETGGGDGHFCRIAIDQNDNPRLVYYNWSNGNIMAAAYQQDSWNKEIVSWLPMNIGSYMPISFKIDRAGNSHILAQTSQINYFRKNGSAYDKVTVESQFVGQVYYCSLDLDRSANPHIVYWHDTLGVLKYATTNNYYHVSGYIRTAEGIGIAGINMTLTGLTSQACVTDSNGYYEFSGLSFGNYLVTPSKTGYSFNPQELSYSLVGSDQDNCNFTSISGNIDTEAKTLEFTNTRFNPLKGEKLTIQYNLIESGYVNIKIYNIMGEMVMNLVDEDKSSGVYSINWNGRNEAGETVASGIYLVRVVISGSEYIKKIALIK